MTFIAEESGKGDWDNAYVVSELIRRIKEQGDEAPDHDFAQASVRLFAWICSQREWSLLRDFPVFSDEHDSEIRRVIHLTQATGEEVTTLAPINVWPQDLQPFFELFPRRHIIAHDFFEAIPNNDTWLALDEEGFVRRDVIVNKEIYLDTFLPSEPLTEEDHETSDYVNVTNVVFLTRDEIGIMARVRQSRRLARKFWHFLTEWLIVNDPEGLEINEAFCGL